MPDMGGQVEMGGEVSLTKNAPDPMVGSMDSGGDLTIRARLSGDELAVTITAAVPYGSRSVTVTRTVDGTERLAEALRGILHREGDAVLRDGRREAARAMLVALDKGEDV